MQVLRLEDDLMKLAVDDVLGRKLQDAGLTPKRRAPKKSAVNQVRNTFFPNDGTEG
jgi:hypothetical protein